MKSSILIWNRLRESRTVFDARFSRCRGLLRFIAGRILGGNEGVDEAVQNCRLAASHNPPRLLSEAAFRAWLLRVLIDEALEVLRENQAPARVSGRVSHELMPARSA